MHGIIILHLIAMDLYIALQEHVSVSMVTKSIKFL